MKSAVMMNRVWSLWRLIRTLANDDAYERYLAHHQKVHPDAPAVDRRTFYLEEQHRKWSGIKRCC